LLDRGFDFFDGAHGRQYTCLGNHRQRFFFGRPGKLISGGPSIIYSAGFYPPSDPATGYLRRAVSRQPPRFNLLRKAVAVRVQFQCLGKDIGKQQYAAATLA
jgi:hypothetical protein